MRELTDKFIKGIEPPKSGRLEISDGKRAGLRLRISQTGKKTWIYEKRIRGGAKRKHTLGAFQMCIRDSIKTIAKIYFLAR